MSAGNFQNLPFDSRLKAKARELRNNPTAAEKKMWYDLLRNEKFLCLKFYRQKPILDYIVDFFNHQLLIAIELDGESHLEQVEYDNKRTRGLNKYGIKVIRYDNNQILESIEWIREDLLDKMEERKRELKIK